MIKSNILENILELPTGELLVYIFGILLYLTFFLPMGLRVLFRKGDIKYNTIQFGLNLIYFIFIMTILPVLVALGVILNFFSLEETA
tara:strand:+ start:1377 stop:1637 length:261 start_codon:yes stop_codon:yes gene_type:complete